MRRILAGFCLLFSLLAYYIRQRYYICLNNYVIQLNKRNINAVINGHYILILIQKEQIKNIIAMNVNIISITQHGNKLIIKCIPEGASLRKVPLNHNNCSFIKLSNNNK